MDWASSEWMQELSPAALQKVQGLEEQMERMQKERQQKILKIDNLEQTINNQKLKLEEEKSENVSLRRELQKLEEQCKDCENKQLKLQNEVQIRDAKISFLENQLDQMKMNLNMVHQFEADIANHKAEVEKAERRNAETEAALKSQEEINYGLQEQVAAFKSQLEAFSTAPDLMRFDCEKPEQKISALQQQIADQEKTIVELKLKLSKEDVETEISKHDSQASSSFLSESQNDPFWNKFESQSSADLRRTVRVKSDSVLSTPQKHVDEKVILLEQRLQQVTREFDCLRSNCEVVKAQMEQKFKDNEKELNAEIKHQSQIIADLDSQLQETKMKLQHDINHCNKELDTTKFQLDKVEKLKLELEEEINRLSAQVQELSTVLQSKEKIIVELLTTKEALEEEKAKLISRNEQLVFENEYLNLEITKRDTIDDENEPDLKQAESSNCKLASESTDNKDEFDENHEPNGESLCEKVQLLELEVANANAVIESKNKELGLMQEDQPKIIQEIEEKVMLIDELQERCDDLENQEFTLKEEIISLQDELSQNYVIISDKTLVIDTVKIELSALKNENEEKALSNSELQEHNVTLIRENSNLQLEVEQKIAGLAVIEKELLSLKEAFEEMHLVKNNLEMNYKELQVEKDSVGEKIRLLEGELEHAVADSKAKADDLDATKKELLELQNCAEQQILICTKLKESESELTTQLETMTEQICKLEAVRHSSESDLKAKSEKIISLEQEITALKNAADDQLRILNELEAVNKNHMQQEKSLQEKVTYLQQEIQQSINDGENKTQALELANKEVLGLRTDCDGKTLLHEELCLQRDKLMTENSNLAEEMEKRTQTLDCLQNEHSLLKASIEQESLAKKKLEDSVTELHGELETAHEKHKEFEELIQSLELHLDENAITISVLNEEISMAKISAEQQQMMLNELQIGNKELCEQNTAFESEIKLLKQEINLKNDELELNVKEFLNLKSEYNEKIRVNEILMQSDAERDNEFKAKLETLIHLEEQARLLQSDLIEKDDQISTLVEETSTLKETLEQQLAVISDLQTCSKNLEDQKQSLKEKIINLEGELVNTNNDAALKTKDLDFIEGELSNLKTELDEKTEVNAQLQIQNENLTDKNKNLQLEVEQNYSTISSFENEIAMMKASFQEEIDKQLKEAAEANLQLKNSQEKLIEFESNVNLLSSEITEKNSVIVSLENKVSLLNLSLEEQVALVNALQTNSQEYEEQKDLLTSKLKSLEQELLEVSLDIQSRKGDFDSIKQEISELEQRYDEKKSQMRRLIDSLIEVDERLKPVTGLLEVVENKMKMLESELQERDTTILALRDEIAILNLSSEESERAKHTQEAEALRCKMDSECLEGKLQELKAKAEFEREQTIDLKVHLLKKNPTYSQRFSKCNADDVRNIAAISLNDDILNYYDSLTEEIQELKVCLEHLQKLEVQTEEQQIVINNLKTELQLSEATVNLKNVDLQEIRNSFHVQAATLTSTEEKLKLVEEELVLVKETSEKLENELSEARVEFQSYHQVVEDICSDMQTTKDCLVEQHAITVDLREQLQREQLAVNKLIRDFLEVKYSASECLQSLGQNVFEPNSERDLADYVKSLMQELQSAVIKIVEEQNENEQSISGKEETSNALVKILHKYDSVLLDKSTVTKQLQDKLNTEKDIVTNLTQALHEQSAFSDNQENITFKLRNDLETCVLTIKTMMQKMKRLKGHFKKNVRHSRKTANIAQKFRTQLPVLKKREMNLRKALKSEKYNVFKMSTFFANLLKMFVEKLNGSSAWPMEHLLFYAFSCFPEVFTQNAVQNFMNELQQATSINPQSPTSANHLSLVPSNQVSFTTAEKGTFVNPKIMIIENTYYLSSEIEKFVTVLKEHNDLKKEAAHWKMQCEIYLPELCARKKVISDLQSANSEFMMMVDNLNSELDNATKDKQVMEKLVQDLITAASDAKGETVDLEERLEQLQCEQQDKIEDFTKMIIVKEQACFETNKRINELEQNLQETNNKNKELHEEVQNVTGGLKDLQKVIAENMETYYSPAQYEALETRAKSFHQEAESLKEKNQEVSALIERIEAAILGILDEFPCDEINYESNADIPIILQQLQKEFKKQREEFFEEKSALDLKNKEIMSFEVSVNELMSKMDTETVMLVEKTEENKKLQVRLTEAENQLQCCCEEIKQKENEIFDLKENYNALSHTIIELQNQLTSLESANMSLNSTIAEVEENLQTAFLEKRHLKEAFDAILVGHIHDYENICISLGDIPTAVQKLCGELMQQKIDLETEKATINLKTEETLMLESSVNNLTEKVNIGTLVLAEKDHQIQQLQIKLEASANQLQSYSEDLKDKEQQLANWKIELDIKSVSLEELKEHSVSLESQNLVLNATIDALKETMRQDELGQQELKQQLDEVLVECVPSYETICQSLEQLPLAIHRLRNDYAREQAAVECLRMSNHMQEDKIIACERNIAKLLFKVNTDEGLLAEKVQRIEQFEMKLKESEDQLQNYEREAKDKEHEINDWKEKYDTSNKSLDELQKHLTSLESENSLLKLTVEELETNLQKSCLTKQQLKDDLDKILMEYMSNYEDSSFDDIPATIQKLCDEFTQKQSKTDELKLTVDMQTKDLARLETSMKKSEEEFDAQTNLLLEKTQEIDQLKSRLEEYEIQVQNYTQSFEDKEHETNDWKEKYGTSNKSLDELQKHLTSLESENSLLKSTVEELETNLQKSCLTKQQLKDDLDKILMEYMSNYEDSSFDNIPATIQKLCDEFTQKQSKTDEVKVTVDMQTKDLARLETSMKKLEEEFNAQTNLLLEKTQEIDQLKSRLEEYEIQVQNYTQSFEDKEHEINDWKEKYDTSNKSLDELQKHLTSLESENSLLKLTVEELETNLQKSCLTKQQLKDDLDKIFMEYMSNYEDSSFGDIPTTIQKLCDEFTQKQSKTDELKVTVDMQTKDLARLETSMKKLEEEFDAQTNLLLEKTREIDQLKSRLEEYEIQVQNYTHSFEGKESEISDWKMKYDDSKKLVDELQTDVSDLELMNTRLNAAIAGVEDDLQKLALERKQLKDSIEILTESIPEYKDTDLLLEDIPVVIQKVLQESAKLKSELAEMKQFVDLKHEEIITLEKSAKEAIEKMNADANLLAEKSKEIQQLQDKLEEADNQLQSYCKDFSVKENDVSKWQKKCETSSKSIEELQKQLATLESTNAKLNSTIDEVEENLQLVYSEKHQLKDTLVNILVEYDSNYEDSLATFEDIPVAIQNLCNEFIQKRSKVNEMGIILESKNGEILSLEKNIEKLKEDVDENAVILDKKTEEMQQLQIKLEKSESQLEKYLSDIKNKDREISDWDLKNEALNKNIDDLKTKLESSQSENAMLNSTIDEVEENLQKIYLEKQQLKDTFDKIFVEHIPTYKDTCLSLEDIPTAIKQLCDEQRNELHQRKLTLDARNEEILVFENSTKEIMGKLNDKTAFLEEKMQAMEQLQIKVMALEDQIQNYCKDIKAKEDELSNWKMNCDIHKTSLSELQNRINSLVSTNEILTTTVKEVEERLQNAYGEKQQLSSRLDRVIAEYTSTSEIAQHEESTLQLKFAKHKELFCTLGESISSSNTSIHKTKEGVDVVIQFIQQCEKNVEKLKQENEEKTQLIMKQEFVAKESEALLENEKLSMKELRNLNFEISQRCKESDKEVCSLQEERKQLLKQLENLNESEINLQKLHEANEALQQDVINWRVKFNDLMSYNESIQTTEAQKRAPSDPETEVKDHQLLQQISDLSNQLQTLEKEKVTVESQLFVLRSASDKAKETEEGLKAKIEQLEHEHASIQRKLGEQLLLVQKKTQAVENMSMSISDMKLENEELESRKNSLQEKLKKLEIELIQCKSDYRTMHNNLEILKLEHAPLVSENESLRAIISNLKAREEDLREKAEINAEIFNWKSCNSNGLNDEDKKSSDSADKSNSAAIKGKKLMVSSAPLIKEFFENATKILNFIVIWKGDTSQRANIKSREISGSESVEQDQLQISTTFELLSSLNEKLSTVVAELQTPDADTEICIESNNDVLLLLTEFKNCLSALCTCLHTYKTTSERFNRKLEQEVQMLRAESTSHAGNSTKICELEKQVQEQTAQKKALDGKMALMKNNSYRLEKCYFDLQKQHSELQEKMQKLESSPAPQDDASNKILEEKVTSLTEELQAVNEKLEKSQTELLDVYSIQAEVQKKYDTSRQECLSLRAHLKRFQIKLREQSESSNASKVKATPLKESAQGAPTTNQESTSKLCTTTGKENRTQDS